jgi:hypothetical protein
MTLIYALVVYTVFVVVQRDHRDLARPILDPGLVLLLISGGTAVVCSEQDRVRVSDWARRRNEKVGLELTSGKARERALIENRVGQRYVCGRGV